MKITLKTLQGKQLPMEVEPEISIETLKQQIETQHEFPADAQQLVAYGKVLAEPAKTLTEYNIKDGDFIVCMIKKKTAPKKAAQPVPAEPKKEEQKTEDATTPEVSGTETNPTAVNPPASTEAAATNQDQPMPQAEAQATPPVDQEQLDTLMAISGQTKEVCTRALNAAFGDPDRAFEYLQTGIPEVNPHAAAQMQEQEAADPGLGGGLPQGAPQGLQALVEMAQNPNFAQLRQRMMQNPQFYQEFMQMLQTQSPDLYATIQQNPQLFMNLILGGQLGVPAGGAPAQGGQPVGMPGQGQQPAAQQQPGGGPRIARAADGSSVLQVAPDELEAIQRIEGFGFSRQRVVQAYFACDKNEEHAINFLLEEGAEDFGDFGQVPAQQPPAAMQQPEANAEQAVPEQQHALENPQPEAQPQPEPENNNNNGDGNNNGGNPPGGDDNPEGGADNQGEGSAFQ